MRSFMVIIALLAFTIGGGIGFIEVFDFWLPFESNRDAGARVEPDVDRRPESSLEFRNKQMQRTRRNLGTGLALIAVGGLCLLTIQLGSSKAMRP